MELKERQATQPSLEEKAEEIHTIHVSFPPKPQKYEIKPEGTTSKILAYRAARRANVYFGHIQENLNFEKLFKQEAEFEILLSLLGLTCEIYIKSILYFQREKSNCNYIKGHKLYDELYVKLSDDHKRLIEEKFKEQDASKDFSSELKKLNSLFEDCRYAYELRGYTINLDSAKRIMQILHETCNEIVR